MSWEVFSSLISASLIPAWDSSFHRSGSRLLGSQPTWVTCLIETQWHKSNNILAGLTKNTEAFNPKLSLESTRCPDVCFREFGALFLVLILLVFLSFAGQGWSSGGWRNWAVAWRLYIWVLDVHCGHVKWTRAPRWCYYWWKMWYIFCLISCPDVFF